MPLLTDKLPPDDSDEPPSDDPNSYALSYLFSQRHPSIELQRAGQVLILSGAGANLMATLILWLNLDFNLSWLLLLFSLLVPFFSLLATYQVWRNHSGYLMLTVLIFIIEALGVGAAQANIENFGTTTWYYLPGLLAMGIACVLLVFRAVAARRE